MRLTLNGALAMFLAAGALTAAEPPYAGKWKENPEKSNFAGTTMAITQMPSGEMQFSAEGITYQFKLDGKDYPDGLGGTVAWTSTGSNSWQTVSKMNGKTVATDHLILSADGKTLTIHTTGTKPNGEPIDQNANYSRVSGGPGLAGKWKTENYKNANPSVIEFIPSGSDGLIFKEAAFDLTCDAKLDSKDYPCTGPTIGNGWTISLTKAGARGLDMVIKKDGKPFFRESYRVSADGKTMTDVATATATNEKTTGVLERQ
jgi:hypothetical protein